MYNVHKNKIQDKISINSYNAEVVTRSIHCQIKINVHSHSCFQYSDLEREIDYSRLLLRQKSFELGHTKATQS